MDKRTFLKQLGLLGITPPVLLTNLEKWTSSVAHLSLEEVAKDEDFWAKIRTGYRLKPDYINLENGYYCFVPQETLENYIHHIRHINYEASYYMRKMRWKNKDYVRAKLADVAGCSNEEIIVTRNTTESLDMIIGGMHWQEGDEAVMASQDYGAMLNMFKLQAKKHGIVNKVLSVPTLPKSDAEIVELYANAITEKTRLLMVCHMINISGQVLPIRKICDMAHSKGVQVMVDGAHAFAHLSFNLPDLDCDYYGTSLHKWLSVPLGAGMLYIKKGKASNVWPLLASWGHEEDDILRLNHRGTHPVHTDLAIINAIEYYEKLGAERKEARLRYLQHYWTSQVREIPNIIVNTPADQNRHCGIGNVGIKDMPPQKLAETLLEKYRIWTVAINHPTVMGCRITPNIYTTTKELDTFVKALKELAEV